MQAAHLVMGNSAALAPDEKRWDWTFYVRGATDVVQSVTIKLHPTFKQSLRTCTAPPFEFPAKGWGTFSIAVLIKWKGDAELRTTWDLQLDRSDASVEIPVPPEILARRQTTQPGLNASGHRSEEESAESEGSDILSEELEQPQEDPADALMPVLEPPPALQPTSAGVEDADHVRAELCARLGATPFLPHTHDLFMHGRGYTGPVEAPVITWRSDKPPRKDHTCPKWLTATEFQDTPRVLRAKVQQLAVLMRQSRKTVAYTGAGISAAVIGQAALSGQNTVGWKGDGCRAPPTFTHHSLGFLGREGLIHGWVQQNHDGLPQKAGFPQERINEIHGSWYDPSNPVVKYSGTLHQQAYPWMREDAQTADLVLVLGTSLGGLNADQVATKAADRTLLPPAPAPGVLAPGAWVCAKPPRRKRLHRGRVVSVGPETVEVSFQVAPVPNDDSDSSAEEDDRLEAPIALPRQHPMTLLPRAGGGLGTVCMNLQQTAQDGKMTLRFFGKSDDILQMLLQELGYSTTVARPPVWPKASRALVPYGGDGRRLGKGEGPRMWLDLRSGQAVKITPGHNIQGAQQPMYMHIGGKKAANGRRPGPGHGKVLRRCEDMMCFLLEIEGVQMKLGIWWLEAAARGGVQVLPVVNLEPSFER